MLLKAGSLEHSLQAEEEAGEGPLRWPSWFEPLLGSSSAPCCFQIVLPECPGPANGVFAHCSSLGSVCKLHSTESRVAAGENLFP